MFCKTVKEVSNETTFKKMKSSLIALILVALVIGLGAGYLGGTINPTVNTITTTTTQVIPTTTTVEQPITTTSGSTTSVTATSTTTEISTSTATQTHTSTSLITTTITQQGAPGAVTTVTATTTVHPESNVVNLAIVADYGGAGYDAFVKADYLNATVPDHATNTTSPGPVDNNVTVSAGTSIKFVILNTDTALLENFSGQVTTPFAIYNDTDDGQVSLQYKAGTTVSDLAISHTFTVAELGLNIPIPPDTVATFTYTFTKPGVYKYFCATPCGDGMGAGGYMYGYITVQ